VQIGIREQREITSALDRSIHLTLVVRTGTCQTCRHDLAVFLYEVLERIHVLVIHLLYVGHGEAAEFLALEQRILLFTLFLEFALVEFFYRMPFCWLLNLRNIFKICEVKHQCFAVPIFFGHKAGKPKHATHLSSLQPVCDLSCGDCLQFESDLPFNARFKLFRQMGKRCAHHRNTGRRVAQYITLCQGRNAKKTVITSLRY